MFNKRSTTTELLDADDICVQDLYQNLKELNTINTLLGGYTITCNALKKVLNKNQTYTLVDIGCGGGDTLKYIAKWSAKNRYNINLYGIDLKQTCIDYATTNASNPTIHFVCDDYKNIHLHVTNVNIIHACLFCHHLSIKHIIELIHYAQAHKALLIINDLQRHPLAYYSIGLLTRFFSKSYLVKNDAPLSVLRGFTTTEWKQIIAQTNVIKYSIQWKWAFRHAIIIYPND
ncbi:MAG: methyltransferase domain-containing protein [Bacteroidia bacterium]|nr:methyltransferase domain-containing protein [Bacteroidia bacterium]